LSGLGELLSQSGHYVVRFFGYFGLRPLTPREQDEARLHLSPAEALLFFAMQPQDQRHCHEMARRVTLTLPGDVVAIRAALLHDVGKAHRRIGVVGRSLATIVGHLGGPMTEAMRNYWDHGRVGAEDLLSAGSDPFVVEFARHHPGGPPPWVTDPRWPTLIAADI
jgi:putative nucleotidyltransferase with HDIG domain